MFLLFFLQKCTLIWLDEVAKMRFLDSVLRLRHLLQSNTFLTLTVVLVIVMGSIWMTVWIFWRSLYLPELRTHGARLAQDLKQDRLTSVNRQSHGTHTTDKPIVNFFTDALERQINQDLGRSVDVSFKYKPTPTLWIHDSLTPHLYYIEPVPHYSQSGLGLLLVLTLGLPVMILLTSWHLVTRLGRPLRQLERAATGYIDSGRSTKLPTKNGSREIRKVNTAFNRLFHTLHQNQKERDLMLAGISHDLRTPLTRIRLTAEMLPDAFLKEGLIYDVEDMDAILEQFISFMKDGRDEAVRLGSLDDIIKEVMVQYASTEFVYENALNYPIAIRPLSIKRMVVNVVNNALRYGKAPIYIKVDIKRADKEDTPDTLHLDIHDSGHGVDEREFERIMQPFERGDVARANGGSGLGLAIVGRIASLHQGKVSIANHPQGGFWVKVRLPIVT